MIPEPARRAYGKAAVRNARYTLILAYASFYLVGRRYHHANHTATIAGDPLPLTLPSSRAPGGTR